MQTYSKNETTLERMLNKLPFHLQKGEHIKGYYRVFACLYDELMDQFATILNYLDVEQAQGYALDLIGDTMDCIRPLHMVDEEYRRMLKVRIMQNNSEGKIEDINSLTRTLLKNKFIGIKQGYEISGNEPAMLKVKISADELEKETVKINKLLLKTGTINTGTHKLGKGIEGITDKVIKKEFKSIDIPDLKHAVAAGVRLEYNIKSKPSEIKIKQKPSVKFKSSTSAVKVSELENVLKFSDETSINLKCDINTYNIYDIECGTLDCNAETGVLL